MSFVVALAPACSVRVTFWKLIATLRLPQSKTIKIYIYILEKVVTPSRDPKCREVSTLSLSNCKKRWRTQTVTRSDARFQAQHRLLDTISLFFCACLPYIQTLRSLGAKSTHGSPSVVDSSALIITLLQRFDVLPLSHAPSLVDEPIAILAIRSSTASSNGFCMLHGSD